MSIVAPDGARTSAGRPSIAGRELLLVTGALAGYFGARLLVEGDRATAIRNAESLLEVERWLGVDVEQRVQGWVLDHDLVRWVLSAGYVWLHWPLLIAVMTYLTWRAPDVQARLRNAIAMSAVAGVVLFAALPMAPPRFMPGFVGTVSDAARRHFLPYPLSWTNQVAAFPSYHVGWTLLACIAFASVTRRRWASIAATISAALVTIAVVGTGNHYVLDTTAGAVLALSAWWLAGRRQGRQREQRPYWADDRTDRGATSDRGDAAGGVRRGARPAGPRGDRCVRDVDVGVG